MSMKMLTILQFTECLSVYLFVTVLLPAVVLRAKIKERRLAEKFLICLLTGNFYVMNLVFVLQLLRISNAVTLVLGTVVPAYVAWVRLGGHHPLMLFGRFWQGMRRLTKGYMGIKSVVFRMFAAIASLFRRGVRTLAVIFRKRFLEWIFLAAILAALALFYGSQLLQGYGYTASDTPVHLYWINGLSRNDIFIDGVYPFGYHCIIYYLHAVFHIDSYVLMRVFSFVQTIMLHMALLAFVRLCCRSRYIAYAVMGIYVLGNFLQPSTYLRFFSVLPQEYGMIFILPSIYFAFRFFQERRQEVRRGERKKGSFPCLVLFAMSFSMTLAVHFYDTMIAGLFCAGVAAGYFVWLVRKQYFGNIVITGLISVMVAVLPMAAAFAMGTPLQGSLGWGMSVINGSDEKDDEESGDGVPEEDELNVTYFDADGNIISSEDGAATGAAAVGTEDSGKAKGLMRKLAVVWDKVCAAIDGAVLNEPQPWYYIVVLAAMGLPAVLGLLFLIFGRRCYGAMLLSSSVFMGLLLLLQTAKELGLPELMDGSRCRIYFGYMLPVVFAFAADGLIRLVFWRESWFRLRNAVSLACVACAVFLLCQPEFRKEAVESTTLVTNEAITCLTNIIRERTDFTWTICSANDETQMGLDHGYHYELISFLRSMELNNMDPEAKPNIQIPTDHVYFFIEKVPIDYTEHYEQSGQRISEQGAIRDLPNIGGIDMYKGENRWILMSRMYYWAKEFERRYPNEMRVYLETDEFICYEIEQNPYRLYNFAIDYGYNSRRVGG